MSLKKLLKESLNKLYSLRKKNTSNTDTNKESDGKREQ